jgi:hypothetical protein
MPASDSSGRAALPSFGSVKCWRVADVTLVPPPALKLVKVAAVAIVGAAYAALIPAWPYSVN